MRIATPACLFDQWFINIWFREVGHSVPFQVGNQRMALGMNNPELNGVISRVQLDMSKDRGDIHLFPGTKIFAIAISPKPEIPADYENGKLSPADEVELIKPSEVVSIYDGKLAEEFTRTGADSVKRQLEVLNGKRKNVW